MFAFSRARLFTLRPWRLPLRGLGTSRVQFTQVSVSSRLTQWSGTSECHRSQSSLIYWLASHPQRRDNHIRRTDTAWSDTLFHSLDASDGRENNFPQLAASLALECGGFFLLNALNWPGSWRSRQLLGADSPCTRRPTDVA